MKKLCLLIKIFLFVLVFFLISLPLSFILKDDAKSYARILFHEFYNQDNIEYLLCGASHVSHGVDGQRASEIFGKNVFSTGTSQQQIDGTYAVLRQAVKLYKIEKVFLELDFAITCAPAFSQRKGFSAEYIVSDNLRDFRIKSQYLLECSSPKYYLNAFLPIGKDKMLTLNPKKLAYKMKSIFSGDYFKYTYTDEKLEYAGKGCVMDSDFIPDGSFSDNKFESAINVSGITDDWKNTVDKIITLCRENGIELIFYSMPGSDFYLNQKGNYDEYYSFCRDFTAQHGFAYYDFNLAKPEVLSLKDSDFCDDNHLSKNGVYKWTDTFCDFFSEKYKEEDTLEKYFYASYDEKMKSIGERIFGLYMITSDDKKTLEITPVTNLSDTKRITYDVYAITGSEEMLLAKDSINNTVALPAGKSGKIRVVSYIDGVQENDCRENFASF
ncbi:MAG: hypothetical protein IJ207_03595 [Treponema sp.]|uniref:hypothetical protein n=1 Tax=Treponema sp. TaxID=166 RepID=UPI0025D39B5C|nr:hypothetical protein [Treponema sp.]MBQ9281263.1 hypothetical protein [Treponema sp.]